MFSDLNSIKELSLAHNELQNLPVGIFSHLSSLDRLNLLNNPIANLPVGLFSGLRAFVEYTIPYPASSIENTGADDLLSLVETNFQYSTFQTTLTQVIQENSNYPIRNKGGKLWGILIKKHGKK